MIVWLFIEHTAWALNANQPNLILSCDTSPKPASNYLNFWHLGRSHLIAAILSFLTTSALHTSFAVRLTLSTMYTHCSLSCHLHSTSSSCLPSILLWFSVACGHSRSVVVSWSPGTMNHQLSFEQCSSVRWGGRCWLAGWWGTVRGGRWTTNITRTSV